MWGRLDPHPHTNSHRHNCSIYHPSTTLRLNSPNPEPHPRPRASAPPLFSSSPASRSSPSDTPATSSPTVPSLPARRLALRPGRRPAGQTGRQAGSQTTREEWQRCTLFVYVAGKAFCLRANRQPIRSCPSSSMRWGLGTTGPRLAWTGLGWGRGLLRRGQNRTGQGAPQKAALPPSRLVHHTHSTPPSSPIIKGRYESDSESAKAANHPIMARPECASLFCTGPVSFLKEDYFIE